MNPSQIININITICGRSYPLKINASEELAIRETVKDINAKIQEYQEMFSGKDNQDYLAMTLLTIAMEKDPQKPQITPEESSLKANELVQEILQSLDQVSEIQDARPK